GEGHRHAQQRGLSRAANLGSRPRARCFSPILRRRLPRPHRTDLAMMAPSQKAAPPLKRMLTHAGYELHTTLRNGEQILLSLILPAIILIFLTTSTLISVDVADRVQAVTPGVLTLAVMSSAFSGQAIATGFERRAGALRMFATTPLGRGGLLGGKVLGV